MLMVDAQLVQKVYNTNGTQVNSLKDITLTIEKGEKVSIMGPSRCRKTTLPHCLSGLEDITSGTIKIAGTQLNSLSDKERTYRRAERMGFIFQSFNLLSVLTAIKNIEPPLLFCGVDQKQARPKALEVLQIVDLADRARHTPAELSGGSNNE
jgi:putative ABC transport system ATP-binding protein